MFHGLHDLSIQQSTALKSFVCGSAAFLLVSLWERDCLHNKHLTRFMQSLQFSRTPKSSKQKKGSASRVQFQRLLLRDFFRLHSGPLDCFWSGSSLIRLFIGVTISCHPFISVTNIPAYPPGSIYCLIKFSLVKQFAPNCLMPLINLLSFVL